MNDMDRVRKNSSTKSNKKIDEQLLLSLQDSIRNRESISKKIQKLNAEWDIERWLETNASIIAFIGVILGFFVNIYWLILPVIVLLFLFQHAVQGWCPPIPIFRRFGVRTQKEIDAEIYGLKAIRGDFDKVNKDSAADIAQTIKEM